MKKLSIYFLTLVICSAALLSSFTSNDNNINTIQNPSNEFEILLNYFETNGNFINSDLAPAIISADEVKANLRNDKYHVIDIRNQDWFDYAHIKEANNIASSELLTYFENKITPADYDKIVLVCYSGQSAAYFTSLLRLAGYDNVYSMKWGMASWRLDFAENSWLKNITNDYADKLETIENPKAEKGLQPVLDTGRSEAKEILRDRLEKAFATPYKEYIIESADVFENPNNFYIINYWEKEKSDIGHIPGAVMYEPNMSLSSSTDLFTLPTDKKIALYCTSGQSAAYAVAYLNVLGYDVGNIAYGANSFMNGVLKEKKLDAFTKKEINTFPVIE